MYIRSAIAAALVATAIPLAAPVAAHAQSHDCMVLASYSYNLNDLVTQWADVAHEGRSAETPEEREPYFAETAKLERAIADQAATVASQMSSPIYRETSQRWANDERALAKMSDAISRGGTVPSQFKASIQAVADDTDAWSGMYARYCDNDE